MSHLEIFMAAVPTAKKDDYLAHARVAATVFRECGATRVVECWGEQVPDGTVTSMPMAVKASADETVIVGWMEWPDKATRDAGMQSAMKDERLQMESMPFDGKRAIFGEFSVLLDA